jgi:phosphinothricin acetyltransferase
MTAPYLLRPAVPGDAPALLAIYRPFVEETAVSFELEVPSVEEMAARVEKAQSRWQWLVAARDGEILGYAYGSAFRERPAYRFSAEVSAYVQARHHRQGVARALYENLLADLSDRGYCRALAGIALPNDASVALHRALGFEPVGVFQAVGRKFGRWHDVAWFQRGLRGGPPEE